MAGFAMTQKGEQYVLNWLCHGTLPAKLDLWIGYLTGNPGETGTGPEVSGNGYARTQLVNISGGTSVFGSVTPNISPATGSYCENVSEIEFNIATGNQGNISHIGIWDAASGGNMIAYKELTIPQSISAGQQIKFPIGKLKISQD